MNLLKRISQLRSLQGLVSKEAIEITRLMHEKQQQRGKVASKLQGFRNTYNTAIQTHNKLLSRSKCLNPQLLSNTQVYLDKLQRDIDNAQKIVASTEAEIIKYENILLKLLAKEKGYQKVTDSYVQDLRVIDEKRAYLDSTREFSNDKATLL